MYIHNLSPIYVSSDAGIRLAHANALLSENS